MKQNPGNRNSTRWQKKIVKTAVTFFVEGNKHNTELEKQLSYEKH